MKILIRIIVGILICFILLLIVLRITGLNPHGPQHVGDDWHARNYPGLWLTGQVETAPVTDWSFTDDMPTIMVQTRTSYLLPHSVIVACNVYNGNLYLVPAHPASIKISWVEDVARDPHVRLKVGDKLYDRTLFEVTDPVERAGALASRLKKYGDEHPNYFHPPRVNPPNYSVHVYRVMQ